MSPDLGDLIGVLVVIWYLAAVGAATFSLVALLWLIRPRTRRLMFYGLLALCGGALYLLLYGLDVPSIVALATDEYQDIPPSSTVRTLLPALLWTLTSWSLTRAMLLIPRERLAQAPWLRWKLPWRGHA